MKFALVGDEVVTARQDGTVGLNAKCGPLVVEACVAQANAADDLLAALRDLLAFFREFDGPKVWQEIDHPAKDRAVALLERVHP